MKASAERPRQHGSRTDGSCHDGSRDDERLTPGLSVDRLHETLASLHEGVQILSPRWRYLFVNDAVARQGHRTKEELLGRTMPECYPGIERTPLFAVLERCMRERRVETVENEFGYDDGTRAWFELRIQPCPEGLVILSLDISERKRLEALLRQGEKLRALGQLAASVAHDLKNIFNPIALETELLRRQVGSGVETAEQLFVRIEDAIRMGSEMVERLRSFSRCEPERSPGAADLNRIADEAVELCMPRLRQRIGVGLRRVRGQAPLVPVHASELVSGVVNLLVNALEAVPSNGTVTVRTAAGDEGGVIEVTDDGPGMPPEVHRRAFEPFFTTKAHGTGLGLASLHAFAQRHGGRVTLDTGPGRGTTVRVWLPSVPAPAANTRRAHTQPAAAPAAFVPAEPTAPEVAPALTDPAPGHAERRVLVVEDEPTARAALEALLREEGFAVAAAASGEQALAILDAFDPGALITDLRMPGMDGATLARRARARKPGLPVVIMSGLESTHPDVAKLLADAPAEHVGKPLRLERVLLSLERVFEAASAGAT